MTPLDPLCILGHRVNVSESHTGKIGIRAHNLKIAMRFVWLLLFPLCSGQDIRANVEVPGIANLEKVNRSWADSYSYNGVCYCTSDYSKIGDFAIEVDGGYFAKVRSVCKAIGPGPGIDTPGAILYNTIQCGNWPAKSRSSKEREHECPGRVDVSQYC